MYVLVLLVLVVAVVLPRRRRLHLVLALSCSTWTLWQSTLWVNNKSCRNNWSVMMMIRYIVCIIIECSAVCCLSWVVVSCLSWWCWRRTSEALVSVVISTSTALLAFYVVVLLLLVVVVRNEQTQMQATAHTQSRTWPVGGVRPKTNPHHVVGGSSKAHGVPPSTSNPGIHST